MGMGPISHAEPRQPCVQMKDTSSCTERGDVLVELLLPGNASAITQIVRPPLPTTDTVEHPSEFVDDAIQPSAACDATFAEAGHRSESVRRVSRRPAAVTGLHVVKVAVAACKGTDTEKNASPDASDPPRRVGQYDGVTLVAGANDAVALMPSAFRNAADPVKMTRGTMGDGAVEHVGEKIPQMQS